MYKLTNKDYAVWIQIIRQVRIGEKAYNIVTCVKPLPPGNCVALHTLQDYCHDRANKKVALIHLTCFDELLPLIDNIDHPVKMWEELSVQFDNATTTLGHSKALRKFTAARPLNDETLTKYYFTLIACRCMLIGTTENLTDDAMKKHIFRTLYISYKTTTQILEQRMPPPMAQQNIDVIREYAERTTLTKYF